MKDKSVQFFGRLFTSAIVLGITAFFTPGFTYNNMWIYASAVGIVTIIDFIICILTGLYTHPIIKAIIGFILCGIALYFIQFLIVGYALSWLSILFGVLVYAIIMYMLPSKKIKNE